MSGDFKWLDRCSNPFFKSWKNDKRNSDLFFNNKPYKNEKRNSNPFFKVMRKRETKFKSVFQSNAKTKNKFKSVFKVMRKWKTKIKRNSLPFFKVVRKRKTKYEVQIRFSMSCEKEKWKWNLNSIFPCHRKTVGNKVHEFSICNSFQINDLFFSHTNGV